MMTRTEVIWLAVAFVVFFNWLQWKIVKASIKKRRANRAIVAPYVTDESESDIEQARRRAV